MAVFNSYSKKTLPADDDTVLIYDSANGNNKQMKYSDLAKAIIEQYTGTTLNGSAQSVKSFINAFVGIDKNIASGTDLNDLTTPGIYGCQNSSVASTLLNNPEPARGFSLFVMRKSDTLLSQIIVATSMIYTRTMINNGWQSWYKYEGVGTTLEKSIPANADLNSYNAEGVYFAPTSAITSTLVNLPDTAEGAGFSLRVYALSATSCCQILQMAGTQRKVYVRSSSAGNWGIWCRLPDYEKEVEPIANRIKRLGYRHFYIGSNTSATFSIDNSAHVKMIVTSTVAACMGEFLIVSTSVGNLRVVELYKGVNLSIDTSAQGKITVTNGSTSAGIHIKFLILNDNSSDYSITMDT